MSETPFQPKQSEVRQAQVADFASEKLKGTEGKEYPSLFKMMAQVALDGTSGQVEGDLSAHQEGYTQHLREVGGSKHEAIAGRATLLANFDRFADRVRVEQSVSLKDRHAQGTVEHGSKAYAYPIEQDGGHFMVRSGLQPHEIDEHLRAGVATQGVPHFEQVVAGSYEESVTVAETMPGTSLRTIDPQEFNTVTDQQISDLLDSFVVADNMGLVLDLAPDNIFLAAKEGFGLIDIELRKPHSTPATESVAVFTETLLDIDPPSPGSSAPETAHYQAGLAAQFGFAERLRQAALERFPGDKNIDELEATIAEARSVDRVAEAAASRAELGALAKKLTNRGR